MTLAGRGDGAGLLQDFQAVGAGLVQVKVGDDEFGSVGLQRGQGFLGIGERERPRGPLDASISVTIWTMVNSSSTRRTFAIRES